MIDGKAFITTPCKYYNKAKGVIYIQEYDVTNIGEFENGLKSKYNIAEVTRAEFIKTRNEFTTPLLITFNSDSLPETIYLPGEKYYTTVQVSI